ncbi:MAG: Glu-tRNA(Gln) amidotransferase GatDE subunit D, partial [Candidatus Bathyarchaeia archaeon]
MSESIDLQGYKGRARELLLSAGVRVGDEVRIIRDGIIYEGVLAPRVEYGGDEYIVIKLRSGYNIGIRVTSGDVKVEKLPARREVRYKPPTIPEAKADLPRIAILGT